MIYPATHNITILQNATWQGVYRATQQRQTLTGVAIAAGSPTFTALCHGLVANDKVVFTGGTEVPCGLNLNTVYFVIATGLTTTDFRVSATSGGASITVTGNATGTFYVAKPLNLSGYTVDADIKGLIDLAQVATFTTTVINAADGAFTLALTPATTAAFEVGRYGYDISLTSGAGERYYWVTGVATVELTYSRS
jgi:hypothetical protein